MSQLGRWHNAFARGYLPMGIFKTIRVAFLSMANPVIPMFPRFPLANTGDV
jgi:hypothetical protein